jgi:hypothetical protein
MSPLDFLAVVLPTPGHGFYCAAEFSTTKKEHIYVQDTQDFYPQVDDWVAAKKNVFFALSTFEVSGKRQAANARFIKALFIDMDGYASKKQAAIALHAFLQETGLGELGMPWMVGSGGGLHCYWPFEEAVSIDVWKPMAENFKKLCKQKKLNIDMTVTADSARVLRIPETFNFKEKYPEPRLVSVLAEGSVFNFKVLRDSIRELLEEDSIAPAGEGLGMRPDFAKNPPTATAVKLFENSETRFKNILRKTMDGKGCLQLSHFVENATEEGMEPLWRAWLSIAKPCSDGAKAALWLTQQHPYDTTRMHQKLGEIKGPYPCTKFDSENPGVCNGCQFFGKITNPLALGRETKVETGEKEIEVALPQEDTQAPVEVVKILRPTPPRGYGYGQRGGIFLEKEMEDAEGVMVKKPMMLLPYDLFVVDILHQGPDHTIHMLALRPNGAVNITMPQKAIVSKDETVKCLASQNIIASFGSGNDKNLWDYVRACVEAASTGKVAVKVPSNYGWQEDNTIVYAGKIFSKNAPPVTVPMPGLENIVANTKPTGSLAGWVDFVQLLINKRMYTHLAVLLAGAGAPLMKFTGIYGITFHCGSTESGTGKTLALEAAASVWGHPTHYRTGKGTSPVAMQQRLGLLNSFPLITDEVTSKNRNNFEWFPEFLLDMTEGRGKERMESGSNKERINLSTWMTNAIMSSNTHAIDSLTGGRMHSSEGELRRLIEFIMSDELSWEPHEIDTIKSLQQNYGYAGERLVQYFVDNVELLQKLVPESVRYAYTEFGATNDERFWMAGIATIIAIGSIFGSKHTGIINFPMKEIIGVIKKTIVAARSNVRSSARSAEDVLNAYTRDNYGSFIVIKHVEGGKILAELGHGGMVDQSLTRNKIMGRVEHGMTTDHIDYYIEEQLLKAYCSSMSFGYADFKRQLAQQFSVSHMPKKDMTSRTKGPQMRVSALKISRRISDMDDEIKNTLSLGED